MNITEYEHIYSLLQSCCFANYPNPMIKIIWENYLSFNDNVTIIDTDLILNCNYSNKRSHVLTHNYKQSHPFDSLVPRELINKYIWSEQLNTFMKSNYIFTKPSLVEFNWTYPIECHIAIFSYYNYNKEFVICLIITPIKMTSTTANFHEIINHPQYQDIHELQSNHELQSKYNLELPKINSEVYKIFCNLKFKLYSIIHDNLNKSQTNKIHFCGYGVGGAIANTSAVFTKIFFGHVDVTCTTFGSPMCGNKTFMIIYNSIIKDAYRVAIINDNLPQLKINRNFYHVGKPIYFSSKLTYKEKDKDKIHVSLNKYLYLISRDKSLIENNL